MTPATCSGLRQRPKILIAGRDQLDGRGSPRREDLASPAWLLGYGSVARATQT
jgi:hypothetical protein